MKTLAWTGLASGATALIGSLANTRTAWYESLRKPSFQPPPVAFPLVWTPLYVDIAVSSAAVIDRAEEPAAFERALAGNLALNAAWTWIFFRARAPRAATAECAVLALSSADLARRAYAVDRRAGLALVPYAAWTAFATVLSAAVARLNPTIER